MKLLNITLEYIRGSLSMHNIVLGGTFMHKGYSGWYFYACKMSQAVVWGEISRPAQG